MAERPPAWRCAQNYLVDCGPHAGVPGGVPGFDEAAWQEPHDYLLIDGRGGTQRTFTTTFWSVDEELGMSGFAVIGSALVKRAASIFTNSGRISRSDEVVLDGLLAIEPAEEAAFASAFERSRVQASAKARRASERADARLAAIPGALEDHAAGNAFRCAQELLCARVRAYGIDIDEAMLRMLVRFGRVQRLAATLSPALDRVVIACRLAAFDSTLEREPVAAGYPEDARAPSALAPPVLAELQALSADLGKLHDELMKTAEGQEWVDANLNAAQYRAAAGQVAQAREYLRSPGFPAPP